MTENNNKKWSLAHIGINAEDEAKALAAADILAQAFGFEVCDGKTSVFSGGVIEIMKGCGVGKHGHIAFRVDSISEEIEVLEKRGVVFDYAHFKYHENGKIAAAYFDMEVAGFCIHLVED